MASSGGGDENEIQVAGTSSYQADEESNWDAASDPDKDNPTGDMSKRRQKTEKEKKLGHRRVGVGGEITYKKIQTSQIMGSIQLGIQQAVGGLASKPERDLLMQDFMTVETTVFSSSGSNHTPAHHYSEFTFKTYAPIAFRYFRDLFGIQPDDFLVSFCSAPLRELSNPGASGSIFYLTEDDEFIMKTVQHKEGEFLQKLLPGYYMNLNQNPRTLLPKFFGLYCYQCNAKNIRLVAMNNLLPSSIRIHLKYDLKGSTYKRKANKTERQKKSPTYKDLDFMEHHTEGLFLEADTYTALVKTIQRDCRVLESFKIMDYSLLVGIHNLDQAIREKEEMRAENAALESSNLQSGGGVDAAETDSPNWNSGSESDDRGASSSHHVSLNRSRSTNRQKLVAHSTAMESIQAESDPIDEVENLPPGGIPARNAKGERLLLFIGIIDILQSYRLRKKIEHTMKALIHDGDTVSVHKPGFYAQRFQEFMANTVFRKIPSSLKHSPSRRKSFPRPLPRPYDIDLESNTGYIMPSGIPSCSTPPPGFDEAVQDHIIERRAPASDSSHSTGKRYSSSSVPNTSPSIMSTPPGKSKKSFSTNVSEVKFEIDSEQQSTLSVGSNSSASGGTSSSVYLSASHKKHMTWTPPTSAEGSTPTFTEGTPSFTESSDSGDVGWPTTPVRGVTKETTREQAISNDIRSRELGQTKIHIESRQLPNEMVSNSCNEIEAHEVIEIVSSVGNGKKS